MSVISRAFDPRDPSIDAQSLACFALIVTYIGLAITAAVRGEVNLLAFAAGSATLTGALVAGGWGTAKARSVDPAFHERPEPREDNPK